MKLKHTFVSKATRDLTRITSIPDCKRPYTPVDDTLSSMYSGKSYKTVVYKDLTFSIEDQNSYFRTQNDDVVKIINIVKTDEGNIKLLCMGFKKMTAAYTILLGQSTIKSSIMGINELKDLSEMCVCFVEDIKDKCVVHEYGNRIICYPLLNL